MAAGLATALALAVPSAAQAAQEAFMVADVSSLPLCFGFASFSALSLSLSSLLQRRAPRVDNARPLAADPSRDGRARTRGRPPRAPIGQDGQTACSTGQGKEAERREDAGAVVRSPVCSRNALARGASSSRLSCHHPQSAPDTSLTSLRISAQTNQPIPIKTHQKPHPPKPKPKPNQGEPAIVQVGWAATAVMFSFSLSLVVWGRSGM